MPIQGANLPSQGNYHLGAVGPNCPCKYQTSLGPSEPAA